MPDATANAISCALDRRPYGTAAANGRYPKPPPEIQSAMEKAVSEQVGSPICGSWRSRAGTVCRDTRLGAGNRCRRHGGATPAGMASANYKTGTYSKVRHFWQFVDDDDNVESMSVDIALLCARRAQLIESLTDNHVAMMATLRELNTEIKKHLEANEFDRARRVIGEMMDAIDNGGNADDTYRMIEDLTTTIGKLKYDFMRARTAAEKTITQQQFRLFMQWQFDQMQRLQFDQGKLHQLALRIDDQILDYAA